MVSKACIMKETKIKINDVDPLRWCNHVVIYLITNIVIIYYVVVRAKPKAMQHANPYHIIQNNRPNVYTQLGCSSGRGGGVMVT